MELILLNNMQFVWLGVVVLMLLIEAATLGLTTIWFALGALISMVLAFLNLPLAWQILLFLVISSVLLLFTRKVAVEKLKIGKTKTNAESIIGKSGFVVAPVTEEQKGQVKIEGQVWTAASSEGAELQIDEKITVEKIEGVTLYVRRTK